MNTKKTIRTLLFLAVLLLFSVVYKNSPIAPQTSQSVQGAQTETNSNQVVERVIDGDTVELADKQKIRLIGINAPERSQPFFDESKKKLEELVLGKEITIKTDVTTTDTYGRTLGYLYIGDLFVNYEMIKSGVAVTETIQPNSSHADEFIATQSEARKNCVGIWAGLCSPGESSCVQIGTINKDGASKNDEWVEIVNTCASEQLLEGYLIKDSSASNAYTFGKTAIKSKGKLKVHSGCGVNSLTDVYWKCPEQQSYVWNNSSDRAYLYDSRGTLVSEVGY